GRVQRCAVRARRVHARGTRRRRHRAPGRAAARRSRQQNTTRRAAHRHDDGRETDCPVSTGSAGGKRTLVGEILLAQLLYAMVLSVAALLSVWSITRWVVEDNLDSWSTRWIAEVDSPGSGFFFHQEEKK